MYFFFDWRFICFPVPDKKRTWSKGLSWFILKGWFLYGIEFWKSWILRREEDWRTRRENPLKKGDNQHQNWVTFYTQPSSSKRSTYSIWSERYLSGQHNMLYHIHWLRLFTLQLICSQKSKVAEVTYMLATNAPEVDRASSLFSLLDQLIADCR